MAQKLSQLYDVDNRYREAQGVADNVAGKQISSKNFIARDKRLAKDFVESQEEVMISLSCLLREELFQ